MTVYELKAMHEEKHPKSHFFDPDTLKFFGETLSTMRVLKYPAEIKDISGETHECYVLSKRSRKFDDRYYRTYAYFDTTTLEQVIE